MNMPESNFNFKYQKVKQFVEKIDIQFYNWNEIISIFVYYTLYILLHLAVQCSRSVLLL